MRPVVPLMQDWRESRTGQIDLRKEAGREGFFSKGWLFEAYSVE